MVLWIVNVITIIVLLNFIKRMEITSIVANGSYHNYSDLTAKNAIY
jgi:hypothetical protein